MLGLATEADRRAWCQRALEEPPAGGEGAGMVFFAKDATRNYGTGIFICRGLEAVAKVAAASPNESFVVQEQIEPQALIDGYRFSVRRAPPQPSGHHWGPCSPLSLRSAP